MELKIDNREGSLLPLVCNRFDNSSIPNTIISCECLPLGDAIITDSNGADLIIFERKTLADLAASIVDGRYQEQSQRLLGCGLPPHNIVYIIEGTFTVYNYRARAITGDALWAAIVALSLKKGFSVMRTINTLETADYIYHVFRKSKDIFKSRISDNGGPQNIVDKHVASLSKVKRENITCENGQQLMLACIPGVSTKAANAILEEYTCIGDLIAALRKDPNCISGICIKCENGKLRRIPKTAVNNLRSYLLYERESTVIQVDS